MQKKILFLLMVAACGSIYTGINDAQLEALKSTASRHLEICSSIVPENVYVSCFTTFYLGSCKYLCPVGTGLPNYTCHNITMHNDLLEVEVTEYSVDNSHYLYQSKEVIHLTAKTTTKFNYTFDDYYTVFEIKYIESSQRLCDTETITIHFENNLTMEWNDWPILYSNQPIITSKMTIEVYAHIKCSISFEIFGTVPFQCHPGGQELYNNATFSSCEPTHPASLCSEYRDTTISPINTTQSLITSTLEPTNTTDTTSTTTATTSTTATTTTATTSTTAATTTTTTTTTKRRPTTTTIDTTVTTPTIETTIKTETTSTASTGTETQATSPKITTLEADMASAMVNGSSIPAEKNSTENETLCPCACYVETPEHFEKRMQETRKELSVKQNETSRYIAKKISAKDDRPSSQAIGVLAVVLFTVLASVIIVPDILSLVRYLFLHM